MQSQPYLGFPVNVFSSSFNLDLLRANKLELSLTVTRAGGFSPKYNCVHVTERERENERQKEIVREKNTEKKLMENLRERERERQVLTEREGGK